MTQKDCSSNTMLFLPSTTVLQNWFSAKKYIESKGKKHHTSILEFSWMAPNWTKITYLLMQDLAVTTLSAPPSTEVSTEVADHQLIKLLSQVRW